MPKHGVTAPLTLSLHLYRYCYYSTVLSCLAGPYPRPTNSSTFWKASRKFHCLSSLSPFARLALHYPNCSDPASRRVDPSPFCLCFARSLVPLPSLFPPLSYSRLSLVCPVNPSIESSPFSYASGSSPLPLSLLTFLAIFPFFSPFCILVFLLTDLYYCYYYYYSYYQIGFALKPSLSLVWSVAQRLRT